MAVYYNENDAYCVTWLRNLIAAGHLPAGVVDDRSIKDVQPEDLEGFTQCHFFAGIGGWPLALRMARWPDERPVWTGSCPCQPFSGAGKQQGEKDARHLWPDFLRLIVEWDVPTIFGEQVASALGREWLVGISTDLEGLDYVVGAADLCAAGVGAPHIRQRLFWVADAAGKRWNGRHLAGTPIDATSERAETNWGRSAGFRQSARCGNDGRLADAHGGLARHGDVQPGRQHGQQQEDGGVGRLAEPDSRQRDRITDGKGCKPNRPPPRRQQGDRQLECGRAVGGLGDASGTESGRHARAVPDAQGEGTRERCGAGRFADEPVVAGTVDRMGDDDDARLALGSLAYDGRGAVRLEGPAAGTTSAFGAWSRYDVVHCTDGKTRRFEPGAFPLAHGATSRVGRLRAYGNAIVPQVATEFIKAYLDIKAQGIMQTVA